MPPPRTTDELAAQEYEPRSFTTYFGVAFSDSHQGTGIERSIAYIWFDAEFSSLDLEKARLLQVAALVTDADLHRLGPPDAELDMVIALDAGAEVSSWVSAHFMPLLARCRSAEAVSCSEADRRLAKMVEQCCGSCAADISNRPLLAGNSIHNDWMMVRRWLPTFGSRLHYRLLDVSSFKTGWHDWFSAEAFRKEDIEQLNRYFPGGGIETLAVHDALFDIKASIAELAYYRSRMKLKD